jgi:guanylate kinase
MPLTPQESFRLHGTFSPEHVEQMFDAVEALEGVEGASAYIQEARGSMPGEDCLQKTIDHLRELAKRCRGSNREEAERIVKALEHTQQELWQGSEYGLEQLNKAVEALKAVGL